MVSSGKPKGWGTVTQRGNRWQARWVEGKDRPAMLFPTQEAAETFLDDRWNRLRWGRYITPAEMTVRDLVETYIERRITYKKWSPATVNLNRRMARDHIYPTLGNLRIIGVDAPRLQFWVDTLTRSYAPNTIKKCTTLLSGAYNHAVALGVVTENPCRYIEIPRPEAKPLTTWGVEDVQAIDRTLTEQPYWLAVYRTMLTTGMRPGELIALTWSDVDFTANRIRIRRSASLCADGHVTVGKTTKTGKVRMVSMSAPLREALLRWQAAKVRRNIVADMDYVFATRWGNPLSAGNWRRFHTQLCKEAKVPPITLHGLRHSVATLMMANGAHPKVVSDMLGHKDIKTTLNTYSHVSEEMHRVASDALTERLYGEKSG